MAKHDITDLLKAVNEASGKAFALWITFLTVLAYLAITIGTTTDLQLLLAGPVKLPLLGVDLPLSAFYGFAPVLFLVLHLYVLMQLYLLTRLLRLFEEELQAANMNEQDCRRVRSQVDNFVFTQYMIGGPQDPIMRLFLWAVVWLSFLVGPFLLLLGFYFCFKPYHNYCVTLVQNLAGGLDTMLLLLLWPIITPPKRTFMPNLLLLLSFILMLVLGIVWANLHPFGLSVENEHLVELNEDKLSKLTVTLSLRNRDLEYALFNRSDFRKADFSHANLTRAKLEYTNLVGANLSYATLREANLSHAKLIRAELIGANLSGANLSGADLSGAKLDGQAQLDQACGLDAKLPQGLVLKPCGSWESTLLRRN